MRRVKGTMVDWRHIGAAIHSGGRVRAVEVDSMRPRCREPSDLVHAVHGAGVRPEAVVHGDEGQAGGRAVQPRQHHVRRVQRVDEVRRERVALLHRARPPVIQANKFI